MEARQTPESDLLAPAPYVGAAAFGYCITYNTYDYYRLAKLRQYGHEIICQIPLYVGISVVAGCVWPITLIAGFYHLGRKITEWKQKNE